MEIVLKILAVVLPYLFQFLAAFLRSLQTAKADDPAFLESVYLIVRGIQEAHPTATGDEKWTMAVDAVKVLGAAKAKVVSTSLVNALIEVALQRVKAEQVATA
jgi:hypothetical protein